MLRVQEILLSGARRSWTIVWPDGGVHEEADRYLRRYEREPGTQRTYAFLLVDHLRWLEREALTLDSVTLRDLERYMGIVGAEVRMPLGEPWRAGRRPYGKTTLTTAASVLKIFYLELARLGRNPELGRQLGQIRLPARADRDRALLGHLKQAMPANLLAPRQNVRRHPRMLPDDARQRLLEVVTTARDRLVVTWLYDGGFRIGELCGLHLADLHLRENADCAQARAAHAHICHREDNPNRARVKSKHPWELVNGVVHGGLIRRVSPAMIHAYFEYMTTEYPRTAAASHGMLLVQLAGQSHGQPLATDAARGMFRRAGHRAGLGRVHPHQARHNFASAVLDASDGNLLIARDAGGLASASTVDTIYGHADIHDPRFDRIPEHTYRLLQERQRKTLARYEHRYGRLPAPDERPAMALFPRGYKNPRGTYAVCYVWFHKRFHAWVLTLDLGPAVPHQARHIGHQAARCRRKPAPHQALPRSCVGEDDRALRQGRTVRDRRCPSARVGRRTGSSPTRRTAVQRGHPAVS